VTDWEVADWNLFFKKNTMARSASSMLWLFPRRWRRTRYQWGPSTPRIDLAFQSETGCKYGVAGVLAFSLARVGTHWIAQVYRKDNLGTWGDGVALGFSLVAVDKSRILTCPVTRWIENFGKCGGGDDPCFC
jgi:hypothetical protein